MREYISNLLVEIERKYGVTVMYACEAGSRAWGLHHEDSDYDIRFIFVQPINQYLMIHPPKEVIEGNSTEKVEFVGWDLRKTLQLFNKQNPSLLEWIHSEVIYVNKDFTKETLLTFHQDNLRLPPLLHHYLNMSKRNLHTLTENSVKQSIHVMRPLLICKWLIKYNAFPPMNMSKLLAHIDQDERSWMGDLVQLKIYGGVQNRIPFEDISTWATKQIQEIVEHIDRVYEDKSRIELTDKLNEYFYKTVLEKE